jgi:hypothetical protein
MGPFPVNTMMAESPRPAHEYCKRISAAVQRAMAPADQMPDRRSRCERSNFHFPGRLLRFIRNDRWQPIRSDWKVPTRIPDLPGEEQRIFHIEKLTAISGCHDARTRSALPLRRSVE